MKEHIMKVLDDVYNDLLKQTPKTKKQTKSLSIFNTKPIDLISFMKENNIPDDAYFDGRDNGYDAFDDILISWDIIIPTTDDDKLSFIKQRFDSYSFRKIHDLFIKNGYIRIRGNYKELKPFENKSRYDMYKNGEFDELLKYYSIVFSKDN